MPDLGFALFPHYSARPGSCVNGLEALCCSVRLPKKSILFCSRYPATSGGPVPARYLRKLIDADGSCRRRSNGLHQQTLRRALKRLNLLPCFSLAACVSAYTRCRLSAAAWSSAKMMRPPAAAPLRRPRQLLTGVKISLLVLLALIVPTMVVFAFVHSLPDSRGGEFRTHDGPGGRRLGSQPGKPMFGGGRGLGIGGLGSMLNGGGGDKEQRGQQHRLGGEAVHCVWLLPEGITWLGGHCAHAKLCLRIWCCQTLCEHLKLGEALKPAESLAGQHCCAAANGETQRLCIGNSATATCQHPRRPPSAPNRPHPTPTHPLPAAGDVHDGRSLEIDGAIIRADRKLPADGGSTQQGMQAPPWGGEAGNDSGSSGSSGGAGSGGSRPVRPSPPPHLSMQQWRQQVEAGSEQAGVAAEQAAAQRRLHDGALEHSQQGLHVQQAQQAQQAQQVQGQGTRQGRQQAAQAHPQRYHRHAEPNKQYPPWIDKLLRPAGKLLPRPNCRDKQAATDCQAWAARGECESRPGEQPAW